MKWYVVERASDGGTGTNVVQVMRTSFFSKGGAEALAEALNTEAEPFATVQMLNERRNSVIKRFEVVPYNYAQAMKWRGRVR